MRGSCNCCPAGDNNFISWQKISDLSWVAALENVAEGCLEHPDIVFVDIIERRGDHRQDTELLRLDLAGKFLLYAARLGIL
jgi:hypothetical protein